MNDQDDKSQPPVEGSPGDPPASDAPPSIENNPPAAVDEPAAEPATEPAAVPTVVEISAVEATKNPPLKVQAFRGDRAESEHLVDAVVMNQKGAVVLEYGDIEARVAPRSAIKPFQALLLASSKWAEKEPRAEVRLALACSSHYGSFNHVSAVREWLRDIKLNERDLACGANWPKDETERNRLICEYRKPEKVHNTCSGKHAGLMTLCQDRGYLHVGYQKFDHPVQQELRHLFTKVTGFDWERTDWGIDGCGIPTCYVPLVRLASLGLIFFVEDLSQFKGGERIRRSMSRYPAMVAGDGAFCSWLIKETAGKILVKSGDEGTFWGASFQTGHTFFLKVRDGAGRAAEVAALEILRRTENFTSEWKAVFEKKAQWNLQNWSGTVVGNLKVV